MKLKSIALFGIVALLAACGGDKQDSNLDGGTVLLSRSNNSETQYALVDGDFQNQDDVKAYVDTNGDEINWQSESNFTTDDELSFSADSSVAQTSRGHNNHGNQGRRFNNRRHGHNHWRPHRRHWTPRRWHAPVVTYWGYNRCGHNQVFWNGRCCYPYSRAYNSYRWQPRWGWNWHRPRRTTTVSSSWYVRVWF